MDLRIISTIGTSEPITLAEAKNYLRVVNTADDALITSIITNARMQVERFINSDIVSKQRALFLPVVDYPINLPYAPVMQIDSVTVDGEANADYGSNGLDNPLISFGLSSLYGYQSTRTTTTTSFRNVQITYTTTGISDESLKLAVLACVAWLYHGRDAVMGTNWKAYATPFKIFGYYGTR